MTKKVKKVLSLVLSVALILPSFSLQEAKKAQAEGNDTFTMYYYFEGLAEDASLYVNIWNKAGLDFADSAGAEANSNFWGNVVAAMKPVSDNDNWYSTDFTIVDSEASDGFTIYNNDSSDESKVIEIDNQWNNAGVYSILVSGEYTAYAVKDTNVFTDLEEAGLDVSGDASGGAVTVTLEDLENLVDSVPDNYVNMGFTDDSVAALKTAVEAANAIITSAEDDQTTISEAYKALEEAINGLVFDAELFVEKIAGYNEDTSIRGVDVSSYISIMDSFDQVKEYMKADGVPQNEIDKVGFKDWEGNVLTKQGFFDLLAASGVNYVRTRVWNNPYDSEGNGYGGGNNDVDKAAEIASYVTAAGMKNLIDFHFSDFWADPGKQKAPKAWSEYTLEQKKTAIAEFVEDSLTTIEAGYNNQSAKVSMVQIGNETNGAFCGETVSTIKSTVGSMEADSTDKAIVWEDVAEDADADTEVTGNDWTNVDALFSAGCDAVHNYREEIQTVIHFTNPEAEGRLEGYADGLAAGNVDYDIFATSYYPYWHGTMSNLTSVLTTVAQKYNKYVMVAETSWSNTLADGDGHENTIDEKQDLGDDVDYNTTVQGQANEIRDVANAVNKVKFKDGSQAGIGFFYWEAAWVPVQSLVNEDGTKKDGYEGLLEANKRLWEQYGSGWAASAAAEYDPDDAGMWYGGSAVDNQAVFDFDGNPLESLNVFKYFKYGAVSDTIYIDGYSVDDVEMEVGDDVSEKLPATVKIIYNNNESADRNVTWSATDIAAVNAAANTVAGVGYYNVSGVITDTDYAVEVSVNVIPKNLLSDGSFEKDPSEWTLSGNTGTAAGAWINGEDPRSGSYGLHFYSSNDMEFTATTTYTVQEAGEYGLYAFVQGLSSAGSRDEEYIYIAAATADGTVYKSDNVTLTGWLGWNQPSVKGIKITSDMITNGKNTVTITINAKLNAEAWGTFDDVWFYRVGDLSPSTVPDETPNETPNETPSETPNETPSETPNTAPGTAPSETPNETPSAEPDESNDSLKLDKSTVTVNPNGSVSISYTSSGNVTTTSSDKTVNVKVGTKKITVTADKKAVIGSTVTVNVKCGTVTKKLKVTIGNTVSVGKGKSAFYLIKNDKVKKTTKVSKIKLTYDKKKAEVTVTATDKGQLQFKVKGLKKGSTTVSFKFNGKTVEAKVTVTK